MKKILILVAVVVVVALAGFLLMKKDKKSNNPSTSSTNSSQTQNNNSTSGANNQTSSQSSVNNVDINNFAFSPAELTVKKGTTLTWTNKDSSPHTVTSTDNGKLDSKTLDQGESYSFTFNEVGTFNYKCTFHSSMMGKVIVTQ
jgi:plastocyanin